MTIDFPKCRELLQEFNFQDLFIEQLGWESPRGDRPVVMEVDGESYTRCKIAELAGAVIFVITSESGQIPNGKVIEAIYREIFPLYVENLLIFTDADQTQSLWYWAKREGSKIYPRDHVFTKSQPGDLLLGKISALQVTLEEIENITVIDIAERLQRGFDVERVTKEFYNQFKEEHTTFLGQIQGIDQETNRRWYTSVLLNRLMFIYFLQRKGFIDNNNTLYLQNQLEESQKGGENLFYQQFLNTLFFEGFAKPENQRPEPVKELIGNVKYLNGGLFLKHKIEQEYNNISIPDAAFDELFKLFAKFSWNLDDTPGGKDNEISPYVLGYIFEKYINQKAFGAYYTRPEITEYLCDRTINKLILDRVNELVKPQNFESINDLMIKLDGALCKRLYEDILPKISLLDPACGSGAFLIAAMQTLIYIYQNVIGAIDIKIKDQQRLKNDLHKERSTCTSLQYFIKKKIITNNLFGVDIMPEAVEIAKLRLFLELVSSASTVNELDPLPNIDFNIMAGNSLIGLIRVDETAFDAVGNSLQGNLLQPLEAANYKKILEDKNKSIELYKKHAFLPAEEHGTSQTDRLLMLRQHIDKINQESQSKLNNLLLNEFSQKLGIKYERVSLTGKPNKRVLNSDDIAVLEPFHWGYHFDKLFDKGLANGGFDAIITNPPWEAFKPDAKEFFSQYSELVTKKKMNIHTFEETKQTLLLDKEIANAWLEYKSKFPHLNLYYRSSSQYQNQISIVDGKKSKTTDINLYKLFLEQCFNLLRSGGECGIVIPSSIYNDLGAKQLREMLFNHTQVTGLFCFENRNGIFEDVHRSFKFVVLTFEKGGTTEEFPAAFMRHDVQDLQKFPGSESINISLDFLRRLSPDSLSVTEFKGENEFIIAEKIFKFPLLGKNINDKWNISFSREFHMTDDKDLFKHYIKGRLPLYEGKMIHQFTHEYSEARYWIDEDEGRKALLGKSKSDTGQKLDYQNYRFAYRSIASSTNIRTLIGTIIPPNVFCGNSLNIAVLNDNKYAILICAILNSFCVDFILRQMVSANINMFYIYQLPVPRLTEGDKFFNDIVEHAAKLICTTPEFDELAQEVGLESHQEGITDETKRAKLRAEVDGIIAHLYNLTEDEFHYILSTFPIVSEPVKQAAMEAYRKFTPMSGDPEIVELIQQGINQGESLVEFKASAWWDIPRNRRENFNKRISATVAAFLNVKTGGTLLIGVDDDGSIVGIEYDYNKKYDTRKNRDIYENNLMTSLLNACGQNCGTHINISFGQVENKDVCKIRVSFFSQPVYIQDGQEQIFYIRAGNSNRKLNVREAHEYIRSHWN